MAKNRINPWAFIHTFIVLHACNAVLFIYNLLFETSLSEQFYTPLCIYL